MTDGGFASGRNPLVELDDLRVWFPIKSGMRPRPPRRRREGRGRRVVHDQARRDARTGRRVGLRKVDRSAARSCGSTSRRRGRIVFDGQDITTLSDNELRPLRRRMQMVFQDPFASLNPRHSVGRMSPSPCGARRRASGAEACGGCGSCSTSSACRRMQPTATPTSSPAGSVSGSGWRARSRSTRSSSSATSRCRRSTSRSRRRSSTCSRSSRTSSGLTYLFIAHDLAVVRHISDRIVVMYLGKVVEVAPADDLYEQPAAPVHDHAAVGDPDPGSGGRAQPGGDPDRRRSPQPCQPAAACRFHTRCPFVQETRCRDEEPLLRIAGRPRRRVPFRGGRQGRADHSRGAGADRSIRARSRRAYEPPAGCESPARLGSAVITLSSDLRLKRHPARPIRLSWTPQSARRS